MNFEDGFNYNQKETNKLVKRRMLHYINAQFNKSNTKNNNIVVSGVKLLESVLHSFNIYSFDFYNSKTYLKMENAFKNAMNYLIENSLIASSLEGKDRFYKFFIRKELFRSREFSNEFEVDMIVSLIYNLGFSFRYEISSDFVDFYEKYLVNDLIINSHKKIVVDFPNIEDFVVIGIKNILPWQVVSDIVAENDYTIYGEYVSMFDEKSKVVKIIPTKKELSEDDKKLFSKLVLVVNSDNNIKKEFEF